MRKIKTMEDIERIRRRNNLIMGVIMIGLMVFASLGYSLMSADGESTSKISELGFDFVRSDGLWKVAIGEEIFGFQYLPSEVSDVDVNLSIELSEYSGQVLYFANPSEGASELLNNIERYILRYQEACLDSENESCEGDLPIKNCSSNLIVFEFGNDTKVYDNESCVYVVGDSVRGVDAFLYEVLDIK
ncbi:MAG: hypothetical protein V1888_02635 [archaeon]